ncbi:hypothetical protein D3C81_1671290 [compost metagenome]
MDIGVPEVSELTGYIPRPVEVTGLAEYACASGIAHFVAANACKAAVLGFQIQRVRIEIPGFGEVERAVDACKNDVIAGLIIERLEAVGYWAKREGVDAIATGRFQHQLETVEVEPEVGRIAVADQHLVAIDQFLATDTSC